MVITVICSYLLYECVTGVCVIKGEHFSYGKKRPMVPPSLLFARDREKYLEWKEWKGDRFK